MAEEIISLMNKLKISPIKDNGSGEYSLTFLLKKNGIFVSQSQIIQIGNKLENIINEIIQEKSQYKILQQRKNIKNEIQMDLCVKNIQMKTIIYGEYKTNLMLDTEKTKATITKINKVQKQLQNKNSSFEVKGFLVSLRYLNKQDIPEKIIKRFNNEVTIIGLNELFKILGVKTQLDENDYIKIIRQLLRNQ